MLTEIMLDFYDYILDIYSHLFYKPGISFIAYQYFPPLRKNSFIHLLDFSTLLLHFMKYLNVDEYLHFFIPPSFFVFINSGRYPPFKKSENFHYFCSHEIFEKLNFKYDFKNILVPWCALPLQILVRS